jgi:hypothetical protein
LDGAEYSPHVLSRSLKIHYGEVHSPDHSPFGGSLVPDVRFQLPLKLFPSADRLKRNVPFAEVSV